MRHTVHTLTVLLLMLVLSACLAQEPNLYTIQNDLHGPYTVERVTDGDTIRVNTADGSTPVRLIGIDTPETKHPQRGVEPYGPEASAYTTRLLSGQSVYLELDVEAYDHYDRMLAYVYVIAPEGAWTDASGRRYTQANHAIAWAGLAQPLTIQPNSQYADILAATVQTARAAGRGMWGDTP